MDDSSTAAGPDGAATTTAPPLEVWGGIECTLNRVGSRYFDQIEQTGHAARIDDLDAFASLGITAIRYPLLWERIAPDDIARPQWQWADERMARLRDLGLRPIAGLVHHGSGPRYTSLLSPHFPELLARYARMVAERYPWVCDYTPINEPLTTARFSALYGYWYPHRRNDRSFVRALLHQVRGTVLAMRAIRAVNPAARLIQTEDCGRCDGTPATASQVAFENDRRWLTWDLLAGRVDRHHPLWTYLVAHGAAERELDELAGSPAAPQVLGLNYYLTSDRYLDHDVDRYPPALHGGNGVIRYADAEAVRAHSQGITGHADHLVDAWQRYRIPVAITEVHLGCTREEQMRWLRDAWRGAHDARRRGADVGAVTAWALLGSFDWDSLVTESRNHYESGAFDVRSRQPRQTALARVIRGFARGEDYLEPALDHPGWWQRPERLMHPVHPAHPVHPVHAERPEHAPLLILGRTGTLARACHRIAARRGLPTFVASRQDADITDDAAVRALIARVKPWGVINATGYVRVDDAEAASDPCFGVNTVGAANVAAVCGERQLPLVTFSSDLVFDGAARSRPYMESDQPRPLSVYGASKAEGERRVLSLAPHALVIRTSAFFGPWDTSNFVAQTLDAVKRGRHWRAATDVIVSPTYVPELVEAALDLLLDRERGLWHLSNEGELSWFDFARAAATACGAPANLVVAATARDFGWAAARPPYSALASQRGRIMTSVDRAIAAYAEAMAA
jgi:dTDP-4-dehydrorhamnose reductase